VPPGDDSERSARRDVYQCGGRPRRAFRDPIPRSLKTMTHSPIARRPRRGNKTLWIVVGIVALILVGLVGTWAYLRFTGHDMTGLEGVWHGDGDTDKRQGYDFQPAVP